MEIDLTAMTPEMTRNLNRIAERYRKPYTEFIDRLSERFADAKFWWDTPLASRNIYICRNFLDICRLRLAMDIAKQDHLTGWIVHEQGMQQALKDNLRTRDVQVASGVQLGFKAKVKEKILSFPWTSSEYAFYAFQRRIKNIQKWHGKKSLDAFRGRELTLISTYRVPAEVKDGELQDRYFPGLKGNSDEDIVFFAHPVFGNEAEGKQLLSVLHARDDHICIYDWIEPNDYREVREYIRWCRNVSVPRCTFDGMDVTALVKEALRIGAADNNTMYGIVKGRVLCRLVEQQNLHIKRLIDWYEGQPSSNAMIRRFRAKFPNVSTVAYVYSPCSENLLGVYPSERQIAERIVPIFYAVQGEAWKSSVRQFCKIDSFIVAPSFRWNVVFSMQTHVCIERHGVLIVLSYVLDYSAELLNAVGEAFKGKDIGPIYIKNHPMNAHLKIEDYGVNDNLFAGHNIVYLTGSLSEALLKPIVAFLTVTSSSLEVMLRGVYVINFIPTGILMATCVPKNLKKYFSVVYNADDIQTCIWGDMEGLPRDKVNDVRDSVFTKVNRETVHSFLNNT